MGDFHADVGAITHINAVPHILEVVETQFEVLKGKRSAVERKLLRAGLR